VKKKKVFSENLCIYFVWGIFNLEVAFVPSKDQASLLDFCSKKFTETQNLLLEAYFYIFVLIALTGLNRKSSDMRLL